MTIVLQHQFWDLTVTEHAFEVGLSFGGIPERVGVPFDAVTAFYDPAVQFGFQFETIEAAAEGDSEATAMETPADAVSRKAGNLPLPPLPLRPRCRRLRPDSGGGGEVVRLDRFRKK